jgi:hypothetical protein
LYQGTTSVVPNAALLICHPEEGFSPTRDLRLAA